MIRNSWGRAADTKLRGAVLGLMASALAVSSVHAIPYASLIRVSSTTPAAGVGMDIRYTLNESADGVTIDIVRVSDSVVVATKSYTTGPQVTAGTVTVNWSGDSNFDDPGGTVIPAGVNTYRVRITTNDTNVAATWTPLRATRSTGGFGPATTYDYQTLLNGFSPNDVSVPSNQDSDTFGFVMCNHAFTGTSPRTGVFLLRTDLAPNDGGNGFGTAGASLVLQNPGTAGTLGNNQSTWKTNFDPIDRNILWSVGQYTGDPAPQVNAFVANLTAGFPALWTNANTLSVYDGASPRAMGVAQLTAGDRFGFLAVGNTIERADINDTTLEISGPRDVITEANIGGFSNRNMSDVVIDHATNNLYVASRIGNATSNETRLWRWDAATVANSPGVALLDDINAAWVVRAPGFGTTVTANNIIGIAIDRSTGFTHSNNVYVVLQGLADRGVYRVAKTTDASLASNPYNLNPATDLIVRFSTIGAGWSTSNIGTAIATDFVGNLYIADRSTEQIRSYAPPNTGTTNIVVTAPTSQTFTVVSQTNVVTVDATATPNGTNLFNTLSSALLSFHTGGANNGFAGTNVINITNFGPYDEVIPAIGVGVVDADNFVINGVLAGSDKPLIRARNNSGDGVRVEGAVAKTVTLNNLVIASSNTTPPTDDLINIDSGGHTINLTNSVVTSLGAGPFANYAALPAGLLNGTSAHDAALAQSGDDGIAIGAPGTGVASSLNITNSVVAQQGAGATGDGITVANFGTVNVNPGSIVASNNRHGIVATGDATSIVNVDGTLASPVQIRGNGVATAGAGVVDGGANSAVTVDNTLFFQNGTGLSISDSVAGTTVTDSMFVSSTVAGVTTSTDVVTTLDRVTFFQNTIGVNDTVVRSAALSITDAVFAGAGTTGIAINAASINTTLNNSALVGAGAQALGTAITNPGAVIQTPAAVTADPQFVSTTYSTVRSGPTYYLATRSIAYRDVASINSPGTDLGGGGLWVSYLPNMVANGNSTIGFGGDYDTLADACRAINAGGPRSGGNWTFTILNDLNEVEDSILGQTLNGTTLTFRPVNATTISVTWTTPAAGPFWFAHWMIGTQQAAATTPLVPTSGVIIDGVPAGSAPGTGLILNGAGTGTSRVVMFIGDSDNNVVRNLTVDMPSTGSPQGAVRFISVNAGGPDLHTDNNIVENCTITGTGGSSSATIQFTSTGTLTSCQTGNQVKNCQLTFTSSGILSFAAHGLTITGNTLNGTQTSGSLSTRGLMFVLMPPNVGATTNVIANNVFNIKSPSTAAGIGSFGIYMEDSGNLANPVTYQIYNNMISTQLTGSGAVNGIQYGLYSTPANSAAKVYAYNNTIHQRQNLNDYTMTPFTCVAMQYRGNTANGVFEARNNIIILDEPDAAAFYTHSTGPNMVEEFNTVLNNTGGLAQYGSVGAGASGAPTLTNYATRAAWNAATGDGVNSDEIAGAVGDFFAANPGAPTYTGVFTSEDPVDFRWTGVPGAGTEWAGSNAGLAFPVPTDIDGVTRSVSAPYRGADEGAALSVPVVSGDVDNSGVVDVADLTALANFLATITGAPAGDTDVNNDTLVNNADVNYLAAYLVGNGPPPP